MKEGWGPSPLKRVYEEYRTTVLLYGGAIMHINDEGTITVEPPPVDAPVAPKEEEKKSALDEAKDAADAKDENGGVKPPEDGSCRECKRLRRLNRLRLCYPCFVELVLMDEAKKRGVEWKPGDKHPAWCGCEGLGEHTNGDGSARGFN